MTDHSPPEGTSQFPASLASMTEAELLAELAKFADDLEQPRSSSQPLSFDQSSPHQPQPPQDPAPLAPEPPAASNQSASTQPSNQPASSTAAEFEDVAAEETAANIAAETRSTSAEPPVDRSLTSAASAEPVSAEPVSAETDLLLQLQKLLLNFDQTQLNQLTERLENPERRAADVGQVLHQAILLQTLTDQHPQFVEAMTPTIERAIQRSVRRDELVIADAIFPIMGPAIRKAIATTLESTMQALDHLLEQSLSPRALQWKLESLRTGKSFAEVVLLRTLLYRVEQVFLIHRSTGLLLQHLVAPSVAAQDPDLVSSMLQAITAFMQDSFAVRTGDTLETLRFGDLTIWIEPGTQAVLAGVLRGQAPIELRLVFRNAIERIHQELGPWLTTFQGDAAPFVAARPQLEACFQTAYQSTRSKRRNPYAWILLIGMTSIFGGFGFREWQDRQRWHTYLQALSAEPGIVVTHAERRWGQFRVSGLRDPLAIDPATLLPASQLDADVVEQWQPYLSLHPDLLEARAKQILQPPATVSLTVDDRGVLSASGVAAQRWIEASRTIAPTIPGITQFKENVVNADLQTLSATRSQLEAEVLPFQEGSITLLASPQTLDRLAAELQTLTQLTRQLDRHIHIQLVGRASRGGSNAQNLRLSQRRAEAVLEALVSRGVNPALLSAVGVGTSPSDRQADQSLKRSVTFNVLFTRAPYSKARQP